jgi:uncharacterized membrane protein YidH (DUF202 family)
LGYGGPPLLAAPAMSLNPAWRPAEDATTLINERTWMAGMILTSVAYGIVFTLFIFTFRQLLRNSTMKSNYFRKLFFMAYITIMLILGTLYAAAIAKMAELSFIDNRLFPGGPGTLPFNSRFEYIVY